MKSYLAIAPMIIFIAMPGLTQEAKPTDKGMEDCPMHHQHQSAAGNQHDHEMKGRGDLGMGFSQDKTTHHFWLSKDGGAIQVTADSNEDHASIDQIRMHLKHIAQYFQAGDFNIPMFVHDQIPPGVPMMKKLKNEITYRFEDTENGGRVVIHSSNSEAITAIQEFLQFQIREHKTGDPALGPP
jgi:hypothetical protein